MAAVINRITKELKLSVNTPDYPPESWIINPDLSKVKGFDQKYWKIDADNVVLASESERSVIDLGEEEARKTAVVDATMDESTPLGGVIKQLRADLAAFTKSQREIRDAISTSATLPGMRAAIQSVDIPATKTDLEFKGSLKGIINRSVKLDNLS